MTKVYTSAITAFWPRWLLSFVAFPLGGLLAFTLVGAADTPFNALLTGTVAGLVIGAAQFLAYPLLSGRWILITALSLGISLALARWFIADSSTLRLFALHSAITGVGVAGVQGLLVRPRLPVSLWIWGASLGYTLAWLLSRTVIGAEAANSYAVFGASGAVLYTIITGLLLRSHKGV